MLTLSDHELSRLLEADVPAGDLTTESLGIGARAGRLEFRARQALTTCASEEAVRLFELAGADAQLIAPTGSAVNAGGLLLQAAGSAAACVQAGADLLVTSAPYTAPPRDVQVVFSLQP